MIPLQKIKEKMRMKRNEGRSEGVYTLHRIVVCVIWVVCALCARGIGADISVLSEASGRLHYDATQIEASDPTNEGATQGEDSVDEDPYYLLIGEADRAIASGDTEEAISRLKDALVVAPYDPTNALVHYNLGLLYAAQLADSLALESYENALELAPAMTLAWIGKGVTLLSMRRDYDAYEAFGEAISCDSLAVTARFYHGMIALYGGNREIAEADFAVLASQAPTSTDTALALGTLFSLTGREREAIPYLQELIRVTPAPEYYASLAGCYLELGQLADASETLRDGLELYPEDPELYYYRAWLNRDRYLLDDARKDAERALQLGASPTRVASLFNPNTAK